jgi:hypothetical protein
MIKNLSQNYSRNYYFIISQCSRQETNTLSPEGLPMSNIAVYC